MDSKVSGRWMCKDKVVKKGCWECGRWEKIMDDAEAGRCLAVRASVFQVFVESKGRVEA